VFAQQGGGRGDALYSNLEKRKSCESVEVFSHHPGTERARDVLEMMPDIDARSDRQECHTPLSGART
jgi:hypothetical protein